MKPAYSIASIRLNVSFNLSLVLENVASWMHLKHKFNFLDQLLFKKLRLMNYSFKILQRKTHYFSINQSDCFFIIHYLQLMFRNLFYSKLNN